MGSATIYVRLKVCQGLIGRCGWRREKGTLKQKTVLGKWPIDIPKKYLSLLNEVLTESEEESLERSEEKSIPYGADTWVFKIVKKFKIEQVLKGVGRPKNGG